MLWVLEVLLLGVWFDAVFSSSKIALREFLWEKREIRWNFRCTFAVACSVVLSELLCSEVANILYCVSSPELSSWDQSTWRDDRVGKNLSSSFNSWASTDHAVLSDHDIIVNNTAVNAAACLDSNVLSDVAWRGNSMWEGVASVDWGAVANGGEVSNANCIHLTSEWNIVPDGSPFANKYVSNERGVRCNPSVLNDWDWVVEWHLLSVSAGVLHVCDISRIITAQAVESETSFFHKSAHIVLKSDSGLWKEDSWRS